MSDEEGLSMEGVDDSEQQYLTAEYKDGQLQIVEVTPYERDKEIAILPDDGNTKFMLGREENGLVQLDLLNLTLVKCGDGEESYRLVNTESGEASELSDATVTCVLQTSDGEECDNQESYVMVESDALYFGECSSAQGEPAVAAAAAAAAPPEAPPSPKKPLSPAELLKRAKAMKKARAIMSSVQPVRHGKRGRRAKGTGDLPMVQQLLASPQFKLYLYSCKLCDFKCNAVKQLQAHRASAHGSGAGTGAGGKGRRVAPLPPPTTAGRLTNEEQKLVFADETVIITNRVSLDSKEVEEADVLVCGACGFESGCRESFRRHIRVEHGATVT